MKINIAYPATGSQKVIEIDDEKKLHAFHEKRIAQEVNGELLGDEFKGYIFRLTGGNDKQGFPMVQGVLTQGRVRLLLKKGSKHFRERRSGERKRKSVRGCIFGNDLAIVNLAIVRKGAAEIEGVTDTVQPRKLGPKRASKIRKLFALEKGDDVRKFVIRTEVKKENGKTVSKAPKIQRLVTPERRQRKRRNLAAKRERFERAATEAKNYAALVKKRQLEDRAKRQALTSRRREARASEARSSEKKAAPAPAAAAPKAKKAKVSKSSDSKSSKSDGEKKVKKVKKVSKKSSSSK